MSCPGRLPPSGLPRYPSGPDPPPLPRVIVKLATLNTSSGRSRGGGGGFKKHVVLKMCFVNIYIQYSLTKYGFWSTLSIFLFPFSFHLGRGGHPLPVPPGRYFGPRKMRTYFYNFVVYKFVLSIFIYNIALQNTDFGVLQKSSKHFLISIFFPLGEGDTPSLSHPRSSGLEQ